MKSNSSPLDSAHRVCAVRGRLWAALGGFLVAASSSPLFGLTISGSAAKATFEAFRLDEGDAYVDFESMPPGPLAPFTVNEVTVTIRTTEQRYPSVHYVDWPVVVIPYGFVTSTPSGTNGLGDVPESGAGISC